MAESSAAGRGRLQGSVGEAERQACVDVLVDRTAGDARIGHAAVEVEELPLIAGEKPRIERLVEVDVGIQLALEAATRGVREPAGAGQLAEAEQIRVGEV